MARSPIASGVLLAVAAAVSFGVTTPLVAHFGARVGPLTTAALLYGGAAAVSVGTRALFGASGRSLGRAAIPRLLVIAFFGAVVAPTLLVWGLPRAGATASSLVLNFEAIFTVILARLVHHEHAGRRAALAAVAMLAGGILVALDRSSAFGAMQIAGLCAVLVATIGWALDNTLMRALAEADPALVVAAKASLGAAATTCLALVLGEPFPDIASTLALVLCGATGYGLSLRLYLLAQRRVGALRTGSVFALGPFVGAALGWVLGDREGGIATVFGVLAFGIGVWLHLSERHAHRHVHDAAKHEHAHRHDDGHHDHVHDPPFTGEHTHAHTHEPVEHEHEHAPDVHHAHRHV